MWRGGVAGPTNFQFPCGVKVDLEGRLVVADTLNNRVQVHTSTFFSSLLLLGRELSDTQSP